MIENALRDSCIITLKDQNGYKRIIDELTDDVADIAYIETTLNKIQKVKGELFKVETRTALKRSSRTISFTAAGNQLVHAMKIDLEGIKRRNPKIWMNPFFVLFDQLCNKHDASHIVAMVDKPLPFDIDAAATKMKEFIDDILINLRSIPFKKEIDNLKRAVNKNFSSMLQWADRHFDHCSKLVVVRIDLHFKHNLVVEPTALEARAAVDQLLKEIDDLSGKGKMFEHIRGYIIKREYGINRGIHFHCLFIFNGHKVRQDISYGDAIGHLWECKSRGLRYFYNCNKSKERYLCCGIGMVLRGDEKSRKGLKMALFYLAKRDYYIRLVAENNERNLRKSVMPRPKLDFPS